MTRAPSIKTVLFATEYYPPFTPGGAEWTHVEWAGALSRCGLRVVVVTPNYGAPPREDHEGVTVHRVWFPLGLAGSGRAGWLAHRNPFFHLWLARAIARIARDEGADLIHAQNRGALLGAWVAARARRLPVVVTVRDVGLLCPIGACTLFESWTTFDCTTAQYVGRCVPFYLRHYFPGEGGLRRGAHGARLLLGWLDHLLLNAALRRVNGVIGVSAGILAPYPERLIPGHRRRVVLSPPPSGRTPAGPLPDTAESAATRERLGIPAGPLVLYAGKHSLGKGTVVLVQALEAIRAAVPDVQFAFAGKDQAALPAGADVHAVGELPQRTLFALYLAADVVVVPSIWPEPLSRVLLESMRFGRPVVATAVGGTAEAVEHGVTGLLVPRRDPAALAAAVVELLRDPARRTRMGAAAAARAATVFDESRLAPSLVEAYESLVARPA
jgi:glycosyltransferase involved in cell wall biosynthesis